MKKSLISLMLVLTLICGCFAVAQAMPSDHDVSYYYVSTSNQGPLNLRESKSTKSNAIKSIPYGTEVMIYDYAPGDTWVLCNYDGAEGYVMTRYLSGTKPSGKAKTTATTENGSEYGQYKRMEAACYYATVKPSTPTGYVHMRWAPSKSEPVMADFHNGDVLKVLNQDANWCQVYNETDGTCGWMMRRFLTYVSAAETTSYQVGEIVLTNAQ